MAGEGNLEVEGNTVFRGKLSGRQKHEMAEIGNLPVEGNVAWRGKHSS